MRVVIYHNPHKHFLKLYYSTFESDFSINHSLL